MTCLERIHPTCFGHCKKCLAGSACPNRDRKCRGDPRFIENPAFDCVARTCARPFSAADGPDKPTALSPEIFFAEARNRSKATTVDDARRRVGEDHGIQFIRACCDLHYRWLHQFQEMPGTPYMSHWFGPSNLVGYQFALQDEIEELIGLPIRPILELPIPGAAKCLWEKDSMELAAS